MNNNHNHDDETNASSQNLTADNESHQDEELIKSQRQQHRHQELLLLPNDSNQFSQDSHQDEEEEEKNKERLKSSDSVEELEDDEKRYQKQIKMKDIIIQQLYKSALDAEEQRRLAVGKHLKVIDDLIRFHGQHLDENDYEFQQCMRNMYERYEKHQTEIATMYESDRLKLLEDIRQLNNAARQESSVEEREQQIEIEQVRTKMADDMKSLRHIFDSQFEELDERFETTKNEYLQKTELVSESLHKQMLKREQISKEMTNASVKIDTLRKALRRIRRISIQKSMQNMDRCNHLLARKSQIIARYRGTKTKMEEMINFHHNKLKELTMEAHQKKLKLRDELNCAENVFKMVKLIRKLEKQYEELSGDNLSTSCNGTDITTIVINRYIRVLMEHKDVQNKEKSLLIQNRKLLKQSESF
mmetsp:Transcript_12992/g.24415  ORF Transcript_12992/g.24415 Transcript_12992/m.24415 type:complete len:416 (-) Transcript_12992:574-1821(-)